VYLAFDKPWAFIVGGAAHGRHDDPGRSLMFRSLFSAAADPSMDRSPWGSFWFEAIGARTGSGVRVTPKTSLGLPAVYSCVRVISESFAVLPVRAVSSEGRRRPQHRHRSLALSPAGQAAEPLPEPFRVARDDAGSPDAARQCLLPDHLERRGEITELLPLHPDRMTLELLDNGTYRYSTSDQNGNTIYYRRDEVWHLRGLSSTATWA
jgi:hypothetical protein